MYQKVLEYTEAAVTIEKFSQTQDFIDREYFTLYLRADRKSQVYHREGDKLLTYIGDMGGILQAIIALGVLFSTTFVSHSMTS